MWNRVATSAITPRAPMHAISATETIFAKFIFYVGHILSVSFKRDKSMIKMA
jgi:predicted acyltransferase